MPCNQHKVHDPECAVCIMVLHSSKKPPKTLKRIAFWWLKDHGYEGLFNGDAGCGCRLTDLMPCDEPGEGCEAGYEGPCDCGEGCDWHIGPKRVAHEEDPK